MTDAERERLEQIHNCEAEFPSTGFCKDGERRECSCGRVYEHVCDEAEGCAWFLREK